MPLQQVHPAAMQRFPGFDIVVNRFTSGKDCVNHDEFVV